MGKHAKARRAKCVRRVHALSLVIASLFAFYTTSTVLFKTDDSMAYRENAMVSGVDDIEPAYVSGEYATGAIEDDANEDDSGNEESVEANSEPVEEVRARTRPSASSRARGPTPQASHAPSRQARRRRSSEKERFGRDVSFESTADEVIKTVKIPGTEVYKKVFARKGVRLVVNKDDPSNRYAHTQSASSMDNLPAHDYKKRFHSCAVVGNSGLSLFNERQGKAIDAHDVVIRFNDGPTQRFEKYVGTKTTFRFVNNNWARAFSRKSPRGTSEEAIMLFGQGAARFFGSLHRRYRGMGKPVYFMAPEFAMNARGSYKKAYAVMDNLGYIRVKGRNSPPTGIEGVFFAMEICDVTDLFGFQIENDSKIKYHYHNNVHGVEAAHSFGFQYEFLKVLEYGNFVSVCLPKTHTGSCLTGKASQ